MGPEYFLIARERAWFFLDLIFDGSTVTSCIKSSRFPSIYMLYEGKQAHNRVRIAHYIVYFPRINAYLQRTRAFPHNSF